MASDKSTGSFVFPTISRNVRSSDEEAMNASLQVLHQKKDVWAAVSVNDRIMIIDRLLKDYAFVAHEWVNSCLRAKGYPMEGFAEAQEWIGGPFMIVRYLRRLQWALRDIAKGRRPRIPGKVKTLTNGQVVAQVVPQAVYDKLFFQGITADVWMKEGVTIDNLPETQAIPYFDKKREGKVALVLGAGNVSGIPPTDALSKLFVDNQVVLLKLSPVNAYLRPLIEKGFDALIEPGFMRIAYGGPEEGAYLCNHTLVNDILITGSDKTFYSIVFGSGPDGAKRKENHDPKLTKPVMGELGCVAPLIVVPGPWSINDLAYQAELIASLMADNGGQTCSIPRVMLQHASWSQKNQLLDQLRLILAHEPLRNAYYPGSQERHRVFINAHPEAELFGVPKGNQLPWTLIAGLNPKNVNDICFKMEGFFGYIAETEIEAVDTSSYIDQAVEFANTHLWGTLSAVILVHPASLKDVNVAASLERAIRDLRYGTIALNYPAGANWVAGVTPWGAFPESDIYDIQSGCGFVHNALMFSQVQKTVLRAPFRAKPKPIGFLSRGKAAAKVFEKLVDFELSPSILKVLPIILQAAKD